MYQPRTPGFTKRDPVKRWSVPDRVFFACGSCHILAHAFLERYGRPEHIVTWIKPAPGYWGNHIFVGTDDWVFDFHGYSRRDAFVAHVWKASRRLWPGWDGTLVPIPRDVLISEARSREIEGLWLAEPRHFLHDPLPRARRYLNRFPTPDRARLRLNGVDQAQAGTKRQEGHSAGPETARPQPVAGRRRR